MKMKKKKQRCQLNHEIPTCFIQKCSLQCGFRHPKLCKLFQVAGQCPWKQCSYAHNPQPAGMHQSHCPTSVPLQHPVLVLGPVENDNPVTERLKEALDAIEVLQQQVQGLTRRLEDHILDQKKDDFSSNLVFSSIESMKEENDANHRFLEIQISAASKDRTKLRVELEKHTATHIAGARNALQEGHKSYTRVRDSVAAVHDRVNSTVNDMNKRNILEVKAFEARLQTSMDAQQKLLQQQIDKSLVNLATSEQLHLLKTRNDDSLKHLNEVTTGFQTKLNQLESEVMQIAWDEIQNEQDRPDWA